MQSCSSSRKKGNCSERVFLRHLGLANGMFQTLLFRNPKTRHISRGRYELLKNQIEDRSDADSLRNLKLPSIW